MSSPLEVYYAINYSNCDTTYSFFASGEGLAFYCHVCQIFALPFQILAAYIILAKTPNVMKSMKTPLLVNHFCCTLFDIQVCTLSTPYLLLRNLSASTVGLFSKIGVPNIVQLCSGFFAGIVMISSYVFIFERRSAQLVGNRFRIRRTSSNICYHGLVLLINSSIMLYFWSMPLDQESAKIRSLNLEPCPTKDFFANDVLVVFNGVDVFHFAVRIHLPVIVIHVTLHIIFHVGCTVYYLYFAPSHAISVETQKNQRTFLVGVTFQTLIPMALLLIFFCISLMADIFYGYHQSTMNAGIVVIAMHGFLESITVLIVHRPYRKAVWKLVARKVKIRPRIFHHVEQVRGVSNLSSS